MISKIKTALLFGIILSSAAAYAAPFVVLKDGRVQKGVSIRAKLNGDIILTTERGDITFTKGQYSRAEADNI